MPGMDRKEKRRQDRDAERKGDRNLIVLVASLVGFLHLEKGERSSDFGYKPSVGQKIAWTSKQDTHPINIYMLPP